MAIARSIIVPCYNEEANLPALIERFAQLRRPASDWELVLVNNGSTDASAQVFARELAMPGREFARVVTVPSPNIGYGHGIMAGLRAAQGQVLAWTHADGQTPPGDVLRAFEALENAPDPRRSFVKGRRRTRPLRDVFFTTCMEIAATALLGAHLADINAQPKAFHRTLLALATAPPVDLSLDLYFFWLARKHGFEEINVDVTFGAREHGQSKWAFNWRSKRRHIARTIKFMGALRGIGTYEQVRG